MSDISQEIVKLVSSEGKVFSVKKEAIFHSTTIRTLFECLEDTKDNTIPLNQIDSETLEKIVEYCKMYKNIVYTPKDPQDDQRIRLTEKDKKFMDVDDDLLLKILNAANFLEIPHLIDIICQKAANMIHGKSVEEIRTIYALPNDLSKEEKEEAKNKYMWHRPQNNHDDNDD